MKTFKQQRKNNSLYNVMSQISPPNRNPNSAQLVNDAMNELLAGATPEWQRRRERAEESLFQMVYDDRDLSELLNKYVVDRDLVPEIYRNLVLFGAGQWVNGVYVAAAAIATKSSLDFLLHHVVERRERVRAGEPDLDPENGFWRMMSSKMVEYFTEASCDILVTQSKSERAEAAGSLTFLNEWEQLKPQNKLECLFDATVLLKQLVRYHNKLFPGGLKWFFRCWTMNYGELRDAIHNTLQAFRETELDYRELPAGSLPLDWPAVDATYYDYCASVRAAYAKLADICDRLHRKASGGDYPLASYKSDLAEYHRSVRCYQEVGNRLNRLVRA